MVSHCTTVALPGRLFTILVRFAFLVSGLYSPVAKHHPRQHPQRYCVAKSLASDPANLYGQLLRPTTLLKVIRNFEKTKEQITRLLARRGSSWELRLCQACRAGFRGP
ncbi:hypothetical protein BKA70DRAFT_1336274 [Coprinopsis sp. MPI-PUGE-AT-0042]|nr:hypothetical protein BKA70DRAFT_1336274 [Coprinopsis sp. MPI-PUGE-AT-0042]